MKIIKKFSTNLFFVRVQTVPILVTAQSAARGAIGGLPERLRQDILGVQTADRRPAIVQIAARAVKTGIRRARVLLPASNVLQILQTKAHNVVGIIADDYGRGTPISVVTGLVPVIGDATLPSTVTNRVHFTNTSTVTQFPVDYWDVLGLYQRPAWHIRMIDRTPWTVRTVWVSGNNFFNKNNLNHIQVITRNEQITTDYFLVS